MPHLPGWAQSKCLSSTNLILCFFLKVNSGFFFLRTKKRNKITDSGGFFFTFLLLTVIKDFQFSSSKPLFMALQNFRQDSILSWASMTCLLPQPSPSILPMRWLLRQWSFLKTPAGIQPLASSPLLFQLPTRRSPDPG